MGHRRKLLNFRNANHLTENSWNTRIKVEWKENFRRKVSECSFWKCSKTLFHSLLEVAENSNRTFWLNGKRPRSLFFNNKQGNEMNILCSLFVLNRVRF